MPQPQLSPMRRVIGPFQSWIVLSLTLLLTVWAGYTQFEAHLMVHEAAIGHLPEHEQVSHTDVVAHAWSATLRIGAVGLIISGLLFALIRSLATARTEMEMIALHDELTGLANRKKLMQRLDEAVQRNGTDPSERYAVLFLDFDRFKVINDSLGHEAGDELLRQIADRLRKQTRHGAGLRDGRDLPARLGGDEFVVLLTGRDSVAGVIAVADRLLAELSAPYNLDGNEVVSTASIGIVTSDGRYTKADSVLRDADLAMYQAKDAGKAQYAVFDQQMHEAAVHRLRLEHALRVAVDREQLSVVYQPVISLENGKVIGAEALMRWHHPEYGVVPPDQFVPIAEETGLIVPIGQWMVEQACRQLAHFQQVLPGGEQLTMNVNISRRELTSPGLVERVAKTIERHQITPDRLHLEITEGVIMEHLDELEPVLQRLRDLGTPLCMDDFGTGHSSLSCLHRFPIDVLKIDRAFVKNLGTTTDYLAIVQAVVTLAHTLDMVVVAEGIETAAQLTQLQALECDLAQGYYFAKPMTDEAFESYVRQQSSMGDRAGATAAPYEMDIE